MFMAFMDAAFGFELASDVLRAGVVGVFLSEDFRLFSGEDFLGFDDGFPHCSGDDDEVVSVFAYGDDPCALGADDGLFADGDWVLAMLELFLVRMRGADD